MNIDLKNYEVFFVRLIEDDLSKEERGEVHLFLQDHPELKAELAAFRSTIFSADESLKFEEKELLKKGITVSNCDLFFLRCVENDLTEEEKKDMDGFLKEHPQFQHDLDLYQKTILVPDKKIRYPDKAGLKRKEGRVVSLYARYILAAAVAASLLLIFYTRGIEWNINSNDGPSVAQSTGIDGNINSDKAPRNNISDATDSTIDQDPTSGNEIAAGQWNNESPDVEPENVPNKRKSSLEKDSYPMLVSSTSMKPLPVGPHQEISYHHPLQMAPYLVAVYEKASSNQNYNDFSGPSWLSLASVVGTELLRLSGRADFIKSSSDSFDKLKSKEVVAVSLNTDRFAFYHKFSNKKKFTNSKKKVKTNKTAIP